MMKRFWWLILLLLIALLLASCGQEPSTPQPTQRPTQHSPLAGTVWALVKLNGHDVLPDPHITLSFLDDEILKGFAGCNGYGGGPDSGGYIAADDGSFEIPMLAVTVKFCADEQLMAQENEYIKMLIKAVRYRIERGRLLFFGDEGKEILEFVRSEEGIP